MSARPIAIAALALCLLGAAAPAPSRLEIERRLIAACAAGDLDVGKAAVLAKAEGLRAWTPADIKTLNRGRTSAANTVLQGSAWWIGPGMSDYLTVQSMREVAAEGPASAAPTGATYNECAVGRMGAGAAELIKAGLALNEPAKWIALRGTNTNIDLPASGRDVSLVGIESVGRAFDGQRPPGEGFAYVVLTDAEPRKPPPLTPKERTLTMTLADFLRGYPSPRNVAYIHRTYLAAP